MAFKKTSFNITSRLALLAFFLYTTADVTATRSTLEACQKSRSNFTVVFLHDPPYVKANSTKWHGMLYDFVQAGVSHCFRQYHCNTKMVHWREVFSEDRLSSVIKDENADVAVPITPSLSSSLTEELTNSKNGVMLLPVVASPGLAMVIDYHACKMKIEELTTRTILSTWPVVAVIFLLSGISGISVWALVSISAYGPFNYIP